MYKLHFDHWWISRSEILALEALRAALYEHGVQLTSDLADADASAHLMSAQNVWDAVRGHGPVPIDTAPYLSPFDLETRIFSTFRAVSSPSQLTLHGIPIGAFRNNSLWVNRRIADTLGGSPEDVESWHAWLTRAREAVEHPLGLSRENWQLSLLLETVVLAMHGADFLRRAFGMCCAATLASARMRESLEFISCLAQFVAPARGGVPWHAAASACQDGRCAAIVMGDWVHSEFARLPGHLGPDYQAVYKWVVPGTGGIFLYNVDYVVPVERPSGASNPHVLAILAQTLLTPQVQSTFGLIKGSLPAVRDAYGSNIDPSLWKMFHLSTLCPQVLIPSMSLLQGAPRSLRDAVAHVIRELLRDGASVSDAQARLVEFAAYATPSPPAQASALETEQTIVERHHGYSTHFELPASSLAQGTGQQIVAPARASGAMRPPSETPISTSGTPRDRAWSV